MDARDFENVDKETYTYAGYQREVIDLLRGEIDSADYLEGIPEEDYDPKKLLDINFPAYK